MNKENYFISLNNVCVKDKIETKGKFNYLSWACAVQELKKNYPNSTWIIHEDNNGFPYIKTDLGYFVKVSVTVESITHTQIHPVLDNYNKAIIKPTCFDINTSIQRCLTKAIALHGLGLDIYCGEDITSNTPQQQSNQSPTPPQNPKGSNPTGINEMKNKIHELYKNLGYSFEQKKASLKKLTIEKKTSQKTGNPYESYIECPNQLTNNFKNDSYASTYQSLIQKLEKIQPIDNIKLPERLPEVGFSQ